MMIGAEAHTELAQRGHDRPAERPFTLLRDFRAAFEHTERLGDLEGDPARDAVEPLALFEIRERRRAAS